MPWIDYFSKRCTPVRLQRSTTNAFSKALAGSPERRDEGGRGRGGGSDEDGAWLDQHVAQGRVPLTPYYYELGRPPGQRELVLKV